jgi:hypothetical protein
MTGVLGVIQRCQRGVTRGGFVQEHHPVVT